MFTALAVVLAIGAAEAQSCCGEGGDPRPEAARQAASSLAKVLECSDSNPACLGWAAAGECKKNPGFMTSSCRKSCDACALAGSDLATAGEIALMAVRNLGSACNDVMSRFRLPPGRLPMCKDAHDLLLDFSVDGTHRTPSALTADLKHAVTRTLSTVTELCTRAPGGACLLKDPTKAEDPTKAPPVYSERPDRALPPKVVLHDEHPMPRLGLGT